MTSLANLLNLKEGLDEARYNPEKSIQDGDRLVTMKSQTELDRSARDLNNRIRHASGKKKKSNQRRIVTGRGM
ncbi:hypothetical protein [uncultured Kiloniella sp.]|uniref:hypothetical protein n=1 Tax=uncultured Kiloniella sp. TaxID=1133091 RepID=UPI0026130D7F|nr:hypothetical protein [uncultured Kiloniella sp.]